VIGCLGLAAALVAPAKSLAVSEEDRSLMRELLNQEPSREPGAPPFVLPDVKGASVRLSDYEGRAVMIYFWTTW
jgi:hypothetical protein